MVEELTEEDLNKLKDIFFIYDKDKDGKLDPKEFPFIMRFLGMILSNAQLTDIIGAVPKDEKGLVDLPSFLAMMAPRMKGLQENVEQQIINAFKVLDEDHLGFITPGYLYEVMTNYGEKLENDEAQSMIDAATSRGLILYEVLKPPKKEKDKEKVKEKPKVEKKATPRFKKILKKKIIKKIGDDGEEEEEEIFEEIEEEIEEEEIEEEEEEEEEEQEEEEVREPEEVIPYEQFVIVLNRDEKKKKGKGKGKGKGKK
ncbi:calmodulin-like [Agrilus planipennis]|uniref:Calmodulin-like n=1 Tax=Agrilus planipennis TaxID=224129 RepID=A0A1W4WKP1_AGRPL|nr:calmodulin-like [Agrilus planipennis]